MEVSKPSMEIRFQPALLQEVIDSFIEKTEREGIRPITKEFHELADPIYEKFTLDDREAEFKSCISICSVSGVFRHHPRRVQ